MAARITPRQYDLLLTRSQKLAVFLPVVVFLLMPLLIFFVIIPLDESRHGVTGSPDPFLFVMPLIFVGGAIYFAWIIGSLPYRITATLDQQLQFKAFWKTCNVAAVDLISIEPAPLRVQTGMSGYLVKYRGGSLRFPGQFTGMYILLSELKAANPALDIRGC